MKETRIALLRGVNVGGNHKVPMKELSAFLTTLGAKEVRTYIQSGNVVFSGAAEHTAATLSLALGAHYGFPIPVILRTATELRERVASSPFRELPEATPLPTGKVPEAHHLAFCDGFPASDVPEDGYLPDRFAIVGRDIFLYAPNGLGQTKLDATFFKRLKVAATVRNLRTVQALIDLAG